MPARARKSTAVVAKPDFAALLAGAALPEHTEPVCLRGDLAAEHERLDAELERLERDAVDSLAGNGGAELAEQIRKLEDEMRASTYPVRLRALSRPEFRAFQAKFPARVGDDGKIDNSDAIADFNTELGWEPLLRLSIVDPEMTDAEFGDLMSKLTDNQFMTLALAAFRLNRGDIDVPFSRAASRLTRLTAADSKPPTD